MASKSVRSLPALIRRSLLLAAWAFGMTSVSMGGDVSPKELFSEAVRLFFDAKPVESARIFDQLVLAVPGAEPDLWQRGLALYYAERFADGWGGGMELACQSVLTVLVNFGFLVFGVTDYVSRDMTLHYGAVSAKAPSDEQCQAACRCLGRRLAEWTATYVHGIASEHPTGKLAQRRPPHG
jgi:hypothetical protein